MTDEFAWIDGLPPKPWSSEWFIAETVGGDKVALFPLPEEWSYDFKTSDETYFCASRIKRWMQFPDSEYVSFAAHKIDALALRVLELKRALTVAEDALSRQSWQWTGIGPHPQEVIETVRAALKGGAA